MLPTPPRLRQYVVQGCW